MQQQLGKITWLDDTIADAPPCPACGSSQPKTLILETGSLIPERQSAPLSLVACPSCKTRYWTDLSIFPYENIEGYSWSTRFYVEQGASLDDLIEPIARLPVSNIESCLEIGCGFGFSLDAGRSLFGWRTVGVDPSPLARAGREALDIDIRPIYADIDTELGGPFDVVYGSEVIEHLADPHAFLKICRAHLASGGTLVLTTPDGDSVRPDLPMAALMPILSPGHHIVLFTADSLRLIARKAGFSNVQIIKREHGLVLYASDKPLSIDVYAGLDRQRYRHYLNGVLSRKNVTADLRTGISYRLLKELVNAAEYNAALTLYDDITRDCRLRFGFHLSPIAGIQLNQSIRDGGVSGTFPAPFCLPGLLFFRGMIALNASINPQDAVAWLDAAALIASAFREAYRFVGIDDGETAMIGEIARELALPALCHGNPRLAVDRLITLPTRSESIIDEVTFRLTDLGIFDQARRAASLSARPTLAAMVDGWEYLVSGRNAAAHVALAEATKAAGLLGARAREGDMLALASLDPDVAVHLAQDVEIRPGALERLFTRLVDLGHLTHAAAIEAAVVNCDGWDILGHRGMLALLKGTDPVYAADLFNRAARSAPIDHIWNLKYHEILAFVIAANPIAAQKAVGEALETKAVIPTEIQVKFGELMKDHPAIRIEELM